MFDLDEDELHIAISNEEKEQLLHGSSLYVDKPILERLLEKHGLNDVNGMVLSKIFGNNVQFFIRDLREGELDFAERLTGMRPDYSIAKILIIRVGEAVHCRVAVPTFATDLIDELVANARMEKEIE